MTRDNKAIGRKAAATNKKKDPDFYRKLAAKSHEKREGHYHHFQHLKQTDPEKLKEYGRQFGRGGVK